MTRNAAGAITGATLGDPFADFLLGAPSSFARQLQGGNGYGYTGGQGSFDQSHYSAFVQDEWKVSRDLSLSLGLRWEQARPPFYNGKPGWERTRAAITTAAWTSAAAAGTRSSGFPESFDITAVVRRGSQQDLDPVQESIDRRVATRPHWDYFTPRFGLAWKMFGTNRTVLRVGAGSSIDTEFGVLRARVLTTNIGEVNVVQIRGAVPINHLRHVQGPADACGIVGIPIVLLLPDGLAGGERLLLQPDHPARDSSAGTMVEVGYVGNQARHLRNVMPFNMAHAGRI